MKTRLNFKKITLERCVPNTKRQIKIILKHKLKGIDEVPAKGIN